MTILCDLLKNQYLVLLLFLCHNVRISNVLAEGPLRRIPSWYGGEYFVFARVQQQLELECPVDAWGTASHVEWWKGSLYLSNQTEYTTTQGGLLAISSLTNKNTGIYTCSRKYGSFERHRKENVTIIVDDLKAEDKNETFPYRNNSASLAVGFPPIVELYPHLSSDRKPYVGDQIVFHCMASGWPIPRLFFFKDKLYIQDTENEISDGIAHSRLRLRNLQKTDTGDYKCIAINEIGNDVASHTLHVTDPLKRITTSHGERFIFAHEWQQLKLACPVQERDIASHIEWWKGNISLVNQSGYFITVGGLLVISSLTKKNTGTYTCTGINSFGLFRTNITVIVDDVWTKDGNRTFPYRKGVLSGFKPVVKLYFLPSLEKKRYIGDQVVFHCVASGWPVPRLFVFKDGQHIQNIYATISKGSAHSRLRLHNLKKTDAGAYKCIAINERGDDVASHTLHVTDPRNPPRITSVRPTEVKIEEGSSTVFWCEVKSSPGLNLTIKWLKILNKMESAVPVNKSNVISLESGDVYYHVLGETHVITLKAKPSSASPNFVQKHPQSGNVMITIVLFIVVIGVVATTVYFCKATKHCRTKSKKKEIALSADSVSKEECETLNQI